MRPVEIHDRPRGEGAHALRSGGVALVMVAAWSLGCSGLGLMMGVPTPSPALQAVVAGWAEAAGDGLLPDDGFDCEAHGEALPWAVVEGPPEVTAGALRALMTCEVDPDAKATAVEAGLRDERLPVVGAALEVADDHLATAGPRDRILHAVWQVLRDHPDKGVRFEALEALDRYAWGSDPNAAEVVLGALLDPSPPVVSEVLDRARFRAAGIAQPGPWVATARFALRAHLDPGIRGRSALLLARLAPDDPGVRRDLRGLLHDDHPYTRSAAAEALGEIGDPAAVHRLMTLLDDEAPNGWLMLPFTGTSGRERRQVHTGSHLERVDDAALRALQAVTASMGDDGFAYREVQLRYLELDLIAARRDAREWYEAHLDSLPPDPDATAGTE